MLRGASNRGRFIISPDQITCDYLKDRSYAPKGTQWDAAVQDWLKLASDEDALFDQEYTLDVTGLNSQITWGNSLDMVTSINGTVPYLDEVKNLAHRANMQAAISYMGLEEGGESIGLELQFDEIAVMDETAFKLVVSAVDYWSRYPRASA